MSLFKRHFHLFLHRLSLSYTRIQMVFSVSSASARHRARVHSSGPSALISTLRNQVVEVIDPKSNVTNIAAFLMFFVLYCSIVYLVAHPPSRPTFSITTPLFHIKHHPLISTPSTSAPTLQHVDSSRVFLVRRGFMQAICPLPIPLISYIPHLFLLTFWQAIDNMGFQSVALTASGVSSFMRNEFAVATFDKTFAAGEIILVWGCVRVLCFILSISRSFCATDSNSSVIDGQFVVLGSVLLKYAPTPLPL